MKFPNDAFNAHASRAHKQLVKNCVLIQSAERVDSYKTEDIIFFVYTGFCCII